MPRKLKDVRGLLAPLLRDTLLAFNYAHYAPPGAQILYTNPVFVRSHDFIGVPGLEPHLATPRNCTAPAGPRTAAGGWWVRSRLCPTRWPKPSRTFWFPTQTQALIWGDLVPQMILSAKIPRWWNVTPSQVHWVGLHLRYGRELLAESAFDRGAARTGAGFVIAAGRAGAHARGGALDRAGRGEGRGGACDALGAVLAGARDGHARGLRR